MIPYKDITLLCSAGPASWGGAPSFIAKMKIQTQNTFFIEYKKKGRILAVGDEPKYFFS